MKSYHVEAGSRIKEQVKACYAFLTMDWGYLKETTILGKEDASQGSQGDRHCLASCWEKSYKRSIRGHKTTMPLQFEFYTIKVYNWGYGLNRESPYLR